MLPKITNKKIILALLLLIIVAAPFTNAVVLESGIPNTDLTPGKGIQDITIAQYINYIYLFVLGVIGIAVFASLVFWGVVWISSGIADKRGMALGKIKDAFTGLAIALGAYIILNTINPDLLTLKDIGIKAATSTTSVTKGGYFWGDVCSGILGVEPVLNRSVCVNANVSCNAGGPAICTKITRLSCCYVRPYKYTSPPATEREMGSWWQVCANDPEYARRRQWGGLSESLTNPCGGEGGSVPPKYSTSTPTDRIMSCYEMGYSTNINDRPSVCKFVPFR